MKHTHLLLLTSVVVANFGMISAAPSTPVNQAKPADEAPEYWDANTWDQSGAKNFWHSTQKKANTKASSTASKPAKVAAKQRSETKSASSSKSSPSPKKES